MSVPQDMKIDRGRDRRSLARLIERPLLVRGSPEPAVTPQEDLLAGLEDLCPLPEGRFPFFRQHDVSVLALAQTNGQCTAVVVVVFVLQTRQLCVSTARVQARYDQLLKVLRTGTHEPADFGDVEIADYRFIDPLERFYLTPSAVG